MLTNDVVSFEQLAPGDTFLIIITFLFQNLLFLIGKQMDDKSTSYKSGGLSEKVKCKKVVSKICCMESTLSMLLVVLFLLFWPTVAAY